MPVKADVSLPGVPVAEIPRGSQAGLPKTMSARLAEFAGWPAVMRSGRDGVVLLEAWGAGQLPKVAVKSKNRGGSGRSSAVQMASCSARVAERCATVPEPVARVTR